MKERCGLLVGACCRRSKARFCRKFPDLSTAKRREIFQKVSHWPHALTERGGWSDHFVSIVSSLLPIVVEKRFVLASIQCSKRLSARHWRGGTAGGSATQRGMGSQTWGEVKRLIPVRTYPKAFVYLLLHHYHLIWTERPPRKAHP